MNQDERRFFLKKFFTFYTNSNNSTDNISNNNDDSSVDNKDSSTNADLIANSCANKSTAASATNSRKGIIKKTKMLRDEDLEEQHCDDGKVISINSRNLLFPDEIQFDASSIHSQLQQQHSIELKPFKRKEVQIVVDEEERGEEEEASKAKTISDTARSLQKNFAMQKLNNFDSDSDLFLNELQRSVSMTDSKQHMSTSIKSIENQQSNKSSDTSVSHVNELASSNHLNGNNNRNNNNNNNNKQVTAYPTLLECSKHILNTVSIGQIPILVPKILSNYFIPIRYRLDFILSLSFLSFFILLFFYIV